MQNIIYSHRLSLFYWWHCISVLFFVIFFFLCFKQRLNCGNGTICAVWTGFICEHFHIVNCLIAFSIWIWFIAVFFFFCLLRLWHHIRLVFKYLIQLIGIILSVLNYYYWISCAFRVSCCVYRYDNSVTNSSEHSSMNHKVFQLNSITRSYGDRMIIISFA